MCHFSSFFYRYVMSSRSGSDSPSSCQFGRYHSVKLLLSPARWKPLRHQIVQRPRRISDLCSWTQPSFKNVPPQRNSSWSKLNFFHLQNFEVSASGRNSLQMITQSSKSSHLYEVNNQRLESLTIYSYFSWLFPLVMIDVKWKCSKTCS